MNNTKHIITTLFLFVGLFFTLNLNGQDRLGISRENVIADKGETVCMEFAVENFDDLLGVTFAVQWDTEIVEFVRTENLDALFTSSPFNVSKVDEGELLFFWSDDATVPRSLPDGQIIFSICFEVVGEEGEEARIRIGNPSEGPAVEVLDQSFNDVGLSAPDALINIEFSEAPENAIEVYFDDVDITQGGSVCIPIRVRNFNDVALLSFTLKFNNNRFHFNSLENIERWAGLASVLTVTNNGNSKGEIVYSMIDNTPDGRNLEEGGVLFEICMEHDLEDICVLEEIMISSSPTTIEGEITLDNLATEEVPVFYESGKIRLRTPLTDNGEQVTPVTCGQPNIGAISLDITDGTDVIKYLWSTGETTSSISGLSAGTYDVSISDACLAVDTIFKSIVVPFDGDIPTANAGMDVTFDCAKERVMLNGSGSTSGSNIMYTWRGLDGQAIISGESSNIAEVDEAGRYELQTVNESSGCSAADTVVVVDVRALPAVMAGDDVMLECEDISIRLTGSGATGAGVEYLWTTTDGNISAQSADLGVKEAIEIDRAGTYTLRITDTSNGCYAEDVVVVTGGNVKPNVNIVGASSISCMVPEITISAANAEETGVSYFWETEGGSIVSGADVLSAIVDGPGTYTVTAVNDLSGCMSTDNIVVTDVRTMPMVTTSGDARIGCDDDDLTLSGSGSTGPGFQYAWSTDDGSIISQTPDGEALVNSGGTYTFTVTETANGCTATESVNVAGDNERPLASISGGVALDCSTTSIVLDASNGAGGATGLSYVWSTMDGEITGGADNASATITQPGTYTVRVTNIASGCSNNATKVIAADRDEPQISATEDDDIDCSTEVRTLSATTNDMANMTFQWNLIEGQGQVLSGSNSSDVEVSGPGKYEIVVTNSLTGCSSRDTTTLFLNSALPAAELGMDYDHCSSETILMGNLIGDITGQWTVIAGGAELEDPMDKNCRVNSLSNGVNSFVWTLSSMGCPDYSSDTININYLIAPVAVDDFINVTQGFGSVDIDLLSNDQYSSESGATINLSSEPSLGLLTENGNGQFTYDLDNPNAYGTYTFEYEICDDLCSLNCDNGMVTIDVRDGSLPPIDTTTATNAPISLGITPNGDGLNDQLVFDELLNPRADHKTKRLIVYNRWGDIVHEAQPYNNDWGGTNKSGGQLPQGTYYFVMQLDIGQGAIIEGDVTILQ